MQKRSWAFAGLAFITGAFAMLLRWLQLMNCFEEETELFIPGSPITWLLLLTAAVAVVGFLLLALPLRGAAAEQDGTRALRARSVLPLMLGTAVAVVMLAGALLTLLKAGDTAFPLLTRLLGLVGLAASVSLFGLIHRLSRGKADAAACLCGAVLILFDCFWLIVSYKEHASDPVIWAYAPEVLAIAASTLGFYFVAGYAFGRPKPFAALLWSGLAFFTCLVSAPDDRPASETLMLLAPACALLLCAWLILANTRGGRRLRGEGK